MLKIHLYMLCRLSILKNSMNTHIFFEYECDLEDPTKYEDINKILEEVNIPYSD